MRYGNAALSSIRWRTCYSHYRQCCRRLMVYTQSDYVTRKATEDDRDVIKHVSRQALKVGYKTDYMAGMIERYLQDPNRLIYVAQRSKDHKVVGSCMAHGGLDYGVTFHGEAGRALPDHQNKGLLTMLMIAINEELSTIWPQWTKFKGTSTQTGFYDNVLHKIDMQSKRFAIRMELKPSQIEDYITRDLSNTKLVQHLPVDNLSSILSDTRSRNYFYPGGYMVLEHVIMMPIPNNVQFITNYHDDMLVTGDVNSQDASLSVGGLMTVNDDASWRYNINYTGVDDIEGVNYHLQQLLTNNMDSLSTRSNTFVILMMPITMLTRYGQDHLMQYFSKYLSISASDMTALNQYAFEYKKDNSVRKRLVSPSDTDNENVGMTTEETHRT